MTRPLYRGSPAVLTTKHGKRPLIAPSVERLGLAVEVVEWDTDRLGTFAGDVPRPAPPLETALRKARAGAQGRSRLALASEGSFGPHPAVPWVTLDRELVVFVDDDRGLVVVGTASSPEVLAVGTGVRPGDDLEAALAGADLPTHAVIVRPNAGPPRPVHKGLRTLEDVAVAVERCSQVSLDGQARVQTDHRAHVCPSRQHVIRAAAEDLAARLATPCPVCASPGWGQAEVVLGLPCRWCGHEVATPRAAVERCVACPTRRERPLEGAGAVADPGLCPRCNP